MKKILALVCAITVFVSSIAGALIFTGATTGDPQYSEAVLPVIKDTAGKKVKLYPNISLSGLDCYSAVQIVKNTSTLPLTSLYSVYAETNRVSFEAVKAADYKGAFFYVEIPDIGSVTNGTYTTDEFRFAVQFEGYNESTPSTTKYVYAAYGQDANTWYSMPLGDSQWTAEKTYNTGIALEYGFKGYVYMPFDTTGFNNSSAKFDSDTYIKTLRIRNLTNSNEVFSGSDKAHKAKVTQENPLVYSYPIFVKDVEANGTPTVDALKIDGNTAYLDARLTPATVTDLNVTKAAVSTVGTTDGTFSNNSNGTGVRTLLGTQSALTRNLGTTVIYQRMKTHSATEFDIGRDDLTARTVFSTPVPIATLTGGIMFHVDIPAVDGNHELAVSFRDNTTGGKRWIDAALGGSDTWYLLEDGTTAWVEKGVSDWTGTKLMKIGDGSSAFSGYIFIPKAMLNNYSSASGIQNISEINVDVVSWRYVNSQHGNNTPLEKPINVSAISIISSFNKASTLAYADTGALVDLATGEVVNTDYQSAKPFYGYKTVNDTSNYIVGKAATYYGNQPFVGIKPAADEHIATPSAIDAEGATVDYIKSVAPLSDLPTIRFSGKSGSEATSNMRKQSFAYNLKGEVIGDTTGFMAYIETTGKLSLGFTFRFNNGTADKYPEHYRPNPFKYLEVGGTAWKDTTPVGTVGVSTLPENFKGYIYIPYPNSWEGKATTNTLKQVIFFVGADTETDYSINLGNPMIVKFTTDKVGLIKYNGATEAQNLFSGEYCIPITAETDTEDSSSGGSSGGSSSGGSSGGSSSGGSSSTLPNPPAHIEEPDYDLPVYAGSAPDYTGYNISKVWIAKLNDKVLVDYGLTSEAGNISGATYKVTDSLVKISKYPSIELTASSNGVIEYTANVKPEVATGATAMLYYIEAPAGKALDVSYRVNFTGGFGTNNPTRAIYTMAEGTNTWVKCNSTSTYYATLPAGFKGYIRQDYNDLLTSGGAHATAQHTLEEAWLLIKGQAASDKIKISAPILMDATSDLHVAVAATVKGDTAARNLFTGTHILPGDEALGDKTGNIPSEEPNYDLPAYTGNKQEYSGYRITNAWIAKLNANVFSGYALNENAGGSSNGTNFKVIDSIVNISNYPSFQMNIGSAGTADFIFKPKAATASGANSILYYVELPEGKSAQVSFRVNFSKTGQSNAIGNNVSRAIYIMAEDETNWRSISSSGYFATLPAGFKGYIRQDYKNLTSPTNKTIDETWTLIYAMLMFKGTDAGTTVKASAPILVDAVTSEHVPNVAYIGTDKKAARDLFSGNFVLDGDAALGAPTIEPNYKVPAYTGTPINYGNLDIMHVKTAKLNGSIIIGRDLSEDVYIVKQGTAAAVKSLVGISNYPMISHTDMNTPTNVRTEMHQGKYDPDQSRGARSAMFYVKVPEGQDSDFSIAWSFKHSDGRTTGAYNYSGDAYIMAKGDTKWTYSPLSKYWVDLPAGFEGYVRIDYKDVWCVYAYNEDGTLAYELDEDGNPKKTESGSFIWKEDANHYFLDENWGLTTTYVYLSNPTAGKINGIVSSPILIDEFIPLQTIQNIAYVDGDTSAARNIFTGAVVNLGDFDATAGAEPDYDIPFHKGNAENYNNISIMKTRTARLNDAVIIGEDFSNRALVTLKDTVAKPIKSIHPLSNYPSIEAYRPSGTNEQDFDFVQMVTDPEKTAGAEEIMFYIKAPTNKDTAVRMSWNFKNVKDNKVTGGFNYTGTAYIMDKADKEWSVVNIEKYLINIPAGFEGYVKINISKIWCVYSYDEDGNIRWRNNDDGTRSPASDGDHYYLDKDWGLSSCFFYWVNLDPNQKVQFSAPILVDEIDEASMTPRATFHNGEKFARDIFTGAVLKRSDLIRPIAIGDVLKKMPEPTTELKAKVSDKTQLGDGLATVSWQAFDGAAKYVVRVFKNLQGATGLVYNCVGIYETADTSVVIKNLAKNTRYSIVVYALDADGNEIAVYDYITLSTVGAKSNKDDEAPAVDTEPEKTGLPLIAWIAIGVGAVLLLGGGAVVIVIVAKKRKNKVA